MDKQTVENLQPTPGVFATPETRAALGWVIPRIEAWVANRGDIILLSSADLRAQLPEYIREEPEIPPFYAQGLPSERIYNQALYSSFKEAVRHTGYERDHLGMAFAGEIITQHILQHRAAALTVPNLTGESTDNVCIIALPDLKLDGASFGHMLGGFDNMSNKPHIPGTGDEWRAMIIAHEAQHCADHNDDILPADKLSREISADQAAVNAYNTELERGTVTTPNLTKVFTDMRAIGAVMGLSSSHATSPAVDPHDYFTIMQPRKSLDKEALDQLLSKYPIDDSNYPDEKKEFIEYLERNGVEINFHPDFENTIAQKDIAEFHDKLIAHIKREDGFENATTDEIGALLQSDPRLLYETVQQVFAKGDFAEKGSQSRLALQFLTAADQYAPVQFGTRTPGPTVAESMAVNTTTKPSIFGGP